MKRKTVVKIVFEVLMTLAIIAVLAPGAIADTEKDDIGEQEAASGADASNPTAAVNYQDLRYRYFDLDDGAEKHSFETEGA